MQGQSSWMHRACMAWPLNSAEGAHMHSSSSRGGRAGELVGPVLSSQSGSIAALGRL